MKELQNISFNKTLELYKKYFSLNYLGKDMNNKLACIALTCYITNELKQKGKDISCYDVLLKIGKDFSDFEKNEMIKTFSFQFHITISYHNFTLQILCCHYMSSNAFLNAFCSSNAFCLLFPITGLPHLPCILQSATI